MKCFVVYPEALRNDMSSLFPSLFFINPTMLTDHRTIITQHYFKMKTQINEDSSVYVSRRVIRKGEMRTYYELIAHHKQWVNNE